MIKILAGILFITLLVGCSNTRIVDVKSPCVSAPGGPCGPKRPVNDWWLENQTINS